MRQSRYGTYGILWCGGLVGVMVGLVCTPPIAGPNSSYDGVVIVAAQQQQQQQQSSHSLSSHISAIRSYQTSNEMEGLAYLILSYPIFPSRNNLCG